VEHQAANLAKLPFSITKPAIDLLYTHTDF
jgi:hypothetical protein